MRTWTPCGRAGGWRMADFLLLTQDACPIAAIVPPRISIGTAGTGTFERSTIDKGKYRSTITAPQDGVQHEARDQSPQRRSDEGDVHAGLGDVHGVDGASGAGLP